VVINANILAQRVGLIWLGVGVVILIILYATGRRPHLSGFEADPGDTRVPAPTTGG
jgi:hypothetical protein